MPAPARRTARLLLVALPLLLPSACDDRTLPPVAPPATPTVSDFARFVDAGDHRGSFEVAIVRYRHAVRDVTVDLVSAVHVGDQSYYDALATRFATYDAMLYELVAPEGTRPKPGEGGGSFVSILQGWMKNTLELQFQLEAIDYGKPNFVHADLSPADMQRLWAERGESIWTLLLRVLLMSGQIQQEGATMSAHDLVAALFAKDRARHLKHLLAQQLERIEQTLAVFGDGENASDSVLVGARNQKALAVMDQEIARGRTRLAIFYGAAHMPDIEQRLQREHGFRFERHEWIPAWTIQ